MVAVCQVDTSRALVVHREQQNSRVFLVRLLFLKYVESLDLVLNGTFHLKRLDTTPSKRIHNRFLQILKLDKNNNTIATGDQVIDLIVIDKE